MKKRKILSLLLAGVVAMSSVVPVLGATTQEKIEAAQSEKAEAQSDLAVTQERIQSLESQKADLEQYLNDLNSQYNTLTESIEDLTVKAGEKSEELKKVKKELAAAKKREAQQYENMKLRISYIYENGQNSFINILCQSTSFADFLNRAENVSKVAEYDRAMLKEYEETKKTVSEHEETIEKEVKEIEQLRTETSDKRQEVRDLVSSTNSSMERYAQQISSNQAEADYLLSVVSRQDGQINSLMAQAQQEAEAAAAAEAAAQEAAAQEAAAEEASQAETDQGAEDTQETQEAQTPDYDESETSESSSSSTSTDVVVEEVVTDDSVTDDTSDDSYQESGSSSESQGSSGQGTYLGNFTLTAYCNCAQCCGTAGNQTASGTWPQAGRTVAMAGVPFGTQLLINGNVYTVEDLGTPYGHVDIYFDSHSEALAFGLQHADVYQL